MSTEVPKIYEDVDTIHFPHRTFDLIKMLDKTYPHRCIGSKETLEDHIRYAGRRDLIDELVMMKALEEEGDENEDQRDGTP
jgi:hypothetical protein|tara:strand:- start:718 stop:960 length:243 start_codon:yes stop_codon:yes gene_type:complete